MAHPVGDSNCASWRISSRVIIAGSPYERSLELRNPGMMQEAFPELVLRGQLLFDVRARIVNRLAHLLHGTSGEPRDFIHGKTFQRVKHKGLAIVGAYFAQNDVELRH